MKYLKFLLVFILFSCTNNGKVGSTLLRDIKSYYNIKTSSEIYLAEVTTDNGNDIYTNVETLFSKNQNKKYIGEVLRQESIMSFVDSNNSSSRFCIFFKYKKDDFKFKALYIYDDKISSLSDMDLETFRNHIGKYKY